MPPWCQGPLCELCTNEKSWFNTESVKCEDCPPPANTVGTLPSQSPPASHGLPRSSSPPRTTPRAGLLLGVIFGVLALLAALWFTVDYASRRHSRAMTIRRDLELGVRRLYQALAAVSLVPKLKLVLAFYQSVAVLPTVYNVKLSHTYYKWTGFLNVFDIDWSNFAIPGACLEVKNNDPSKAT